MLPLWFKYCLSPQKSMSKTDSQQNSVGWWGCQVVIGSYKMINAVLKGVNFILSGMT